MGQLKRRMKAGKPKATGEGGTTWTPPYGRYGPVYDLGIGRTGAALATLATVIVKQAVQTNHPVTETRTEAS